MGSASREPEEYTRTMIEYKDLGRYLPMILLLYSWGSLFGVPSKVLLVRVLKSSVFTLGT